jgi:hypothetical protein
MGLSGEEPSVIYEMSQERLRRHDVGNLSVCWFVFYGMRDEKVRFQSSLYLFG